MWYLVVLIYHCDKTFIHKVILQAKVIPFLWKVFGQFGRILGVLFFFICLLVCSNDSHNLRLASIDLENHYSMAQLEVFQPFVICEHRNTPRVKSLRVSQTIARGEGPKTLTKLRFAEENNDLLWCHTSFLRIKILRSNCRLF